MVYDEDRRANVGWMSEKKAIKDFESENDFCQQFFQKVGAQCLPKT